MPSKAEFARSQGVDRWFKALGEPRVSDRLTRGRLRAAGRNALIAAAALAFLCVDLPAPTVGAAVDPQGRLEAQSARPGGLAGFEDVVERVKPAVFGIRARVVERSDDSEQPLPPLEGEQSEKTKPEEPKRARLALSQGSGFFISEDGHAVTAYHVIEGGTSIEISTDDGKTHRAKVVGVDSETDIAILKVDAEESYPFVAFADRMPRIGEWVITVGNPFGLGGTVTAGIVSAGTREIEVGTKSDFIQIDAPVNQGNSGGPAFDVAGRVIGVNSAIISPTGGSVGIGFAIPAAIIRPVVAQLKEKGVVTRGWMGVETQAVTPELADGFGLKQTRGALVAERRPNGPAARAGIRPGDVILTLNGQTLADDRDLARRIGSMAPGKSVHLGILRQGREYTLAVGLSRSPQAKTPAATDPGNTLGDGADPEKLGLGLAPGKQGDEGRDAQGVVVVEVDPQGIAAERGFLPGDVILDVGGSAVTLPSEVSEALVKARRQRRNNVVARVRTGDSTRFVALPTG